jgi:hypothetical protein
VPGVADGQEGGSGMSRATGLHFLWHLIRIQQAVHHLHAHLARPAALTAAASGGTAAAYQAIRQAVISLYSRDLVPPQLRLPLLVYLVPLIESNCMRLGSAEVQALQQAVLDCSLSHQAPALAKGLAQRHVQDVQLALTRGLARALIEEGSAPSSAGVF